MKTTHKQKVKIATKMLSSLEIKLRTPKFQSKAWKKRKETINNKIKKYEKQDKKS